MKKVVISGSLTLKDKIDSWVKHFKNNGYEVLNYPKSSSQDICDIYSNFYKSIDNADILFVINDAPVLKGDMGTSTFAELVYAVMQKVNNNKKIDIYLYQEPETQIPNYNVIKSFLDNNWINIYKFPTLGNQISRYTPFNTQEKDDVFLIINYIYLLEKLSSAPIKTLLSRESTLAHFSASAFVVNKAKDKTLVVNHNILGSWIYPGGHADCEEDLLSVSIREVEEETGVQAKPLSNNIFGIQTISIPGHTKKEKYVSPHVHFDVIYLLEADDTLPLVSKSDENTGVKWLPLDDSIYEVLDDSIKPIFSKLIEKLKTYN